MMRPPARIPLLALTLASAWMPGLAAQGDPAADYEKLRKGLETTNAAVSGLEVVFDVTSLTKPGPVVSALAKTLGDVATGAKRASDLFAALDGADDAKTREKLLQENSSLPDWLTAALEPMKALKKVEAQVAKVEIPVFDCLDKRRCLSLADLQGDKAAATKKAQEQYAAHGAVVARLAEQVELFAEIDARADAASQAMTALAAGWRKAAELGCGVFGSYCGLKYLDADELATQCKAIRSSAQAQKKKAERALELEKTRLRSFAGILKELFRLDVTDRGR